MIQNPRNKILVIEDSPAMLSFEKESLMSRFDFPIITAGSLQECREMMQIHENDFFVALADLVLPDAPNGEVIDVLTAVNIPTIVFTGQYNEALRAFVMSKPIVDYILKSNLNNFQYALRLVAAIHENQFLKALVVDDSEFARLKVESSLQRLHIDVLHADNISQAKKILEEHRDVRLLIVDYHIESNANGIDLTADVRQCYGSEDMTIIGYSSDTSHTLPIEFLKKGANDYISYRYSEEEFTLRVLSNIESMANLRTARDLSLTDYMTGLYNRRYLFESSKQAYHQLKRGIFKQLGVAMIDIDHFKSVNDDYGHDVGDQAIRHVANILKNNIRHSDLLARIGGEEFSVLLHNADDTYMLSIMEKLRQLVEETPLHVIIDNKKVEIRITVSAGFTTRSHPAIEAAIKEADLYLYEAKNSGRNRICFPSGHPSAT